MSSDNDPDSLSARTADLITSILERRIRVTLRRVSLIMAWFGLGCAALGGGVIALGVVRNLTLPVISVGLVGLWFLVLVRAFDHTVLHGTRFRLWLLPVYLIPTVLLIVFHLFTPHGAASFMFGPTVSGYFLALIHSASLFKRRFTLQITVLSTLGYVGIYWACARPELQRLVEPLRTVDPVLAQGLADWPLTLLRAFVLFAAGWMLGHVIQVASEAITEVATVIAQFGMIVDPRVRDLLLDGRVGTEGEERELTVVFADIRGFTTFAENYDPPRLLGLMKQYFDLMGVPIRDEEGTIIEYIGDEIMMVFGAPVHQLDHARRAGRAALDMQRVLEQQRPIWEAQGFPRIEVGIGLSCGPMLVGRIGSSERQKYGVLGDNVNLGSRLQGLTREYNVPVLASDAWVAQAGDAFHVREVDCVAVRGRASRVTVYEIVGLADRPLDDTVRRAYDAWAEGLAAFRAQDHATARRALETCIQLKPEDGPARRLICLMSGARETGDAQASLAT